MSKSLIKAEAERRGIPCLVHFTRISNLPSILEYGLYPRARHNELASTPVVNDRDRRDRRLDATSTSIAFPNSKLFYRFQCDYSDQEWAVLRLDRSILWELDCAFCWHNAADSQISAIPHEELRSPEAFARMFEEFGKSEDVPPRAEQRLKSFDPTDVQAEVLVRGVIEPSRISSICLRNPLVRDKWERWISADLARPCTVNQDYFWQREHIR